MTPGGPACAGRLKPRPSLVSRRYAAAGFAATFGAAAPSACPAFAFSAFAFGWRRSLLLRRQHHDHLPAFQLRQLLHQRRPASRSLRTRSSSRYAELLVRHLAAAEAQRHLRLVAFLEEPDQLAQLDLVVALVGAGPELDFLDLDLLLLELRLVRLLLLAVPELAVVHQLADRRLRERRDLHQVHVRFLGQAQRLHDRHDAELLTVFRYQAHLRGGDFPVDALRSLECDV